jgi:acyl-CoA hydrolase
LIEAYQKRLYIFTFFLMKNKMVYNMITFLTLGVLTLSLVPVTFAAQSVSGSISGKGLIIGTVSTVGGSSLSLTMKNKVVTVDVSQSAFKKREGAVAALTDIHTGDTVRVYGTWTDTTKTAIQAITVRDMSDVGNITGVHAIAYGDVSTIDTTNNTFTMVTSKKAIITVDAGSSTFVRRFGGKSSLAELTVGDHLKVFGTWSDTGKTSLKAIAIRNMSIQAKYANFVGTVITVNPTSLLIQTAQRGEITVNLDNTTIYKNKTGGIVSVGDIKTADSVRAYGIWDRTNRFVNAIAVRDLSDVAVSTNTNLNLNTNN